MVGFSSAFWWLMALICLPLQAAANEAIYSNVKRSTVWIVTSSGSGSGVLVDGKRNLVVTNAHVVGGELKVTAFSSLHDTSGNVWKRSSYLNQTTRVRTLGYATTGRVIALSSSKDLAILELESPLKGLKAIELADEVPAPGDGLHFVGNPTGRPLFTYTHGETRFVENTQWRYSDGQVIDANVICFSGLPWFGNSGGPVANDSGELVGVITGGGSATGIAISIREIRDLLNTVTYRSVVSLHNTTKNVVNCAVRFNDGDWQKVSIQPGHYHIWWRSAVSKIEVDFDYSFADGYQRQQYSLSTYGAYFGKGGKAKPDQAKRYCFRQTGNGLNLKLSN